jgi:hypothetical protein
MLILVHTENFLRAPSDIKLILARRIDNRALAFEELEQLLTFGIGEDRLDLFTQCEHPPFSLRNIPLTCLIIAPISLSIVKILYAS